MFKALKKCGFYIINAAEIINFDVSVTIVIVSQLHVEVDIFWQRAQVLHHSVELPHQQDDGFPGVSTWHWWDFDVVIADQESQARRKMSIKGPATSAALPDNHYTGR